MTRREDALAPVRVGRIEFVNCFPLYHHLERELAARGVRAAVVEGDPATLNAMLVSGDIDVALPSSIAFARHADRLVLLPRVSISAFGAVDSVQLFTRAPLPDVRRVAVTAKSATSVCLLRILFAAWGMTPEFSVREGALAQVLAEYDALLLIGDEALHVLRAEVFPQHVDLGAAWHELTGLPMVFAVSAATREFAAARPAAAAAVGAALLASRDECAAHPEETAAAGALRYDFGQRYLLEYFDKLKFGFAPEYLAGLEHFYRRAAAIGELERVPDLAAVTLVEPPAAEPAGGTESPASVRLSSAAVVGFMDGPQPLSVTAASLRVGGAGRRASVTGLIWRPAEASDAAALTRAIDEWWPGGHIVHGICPQLLEHVGDTCFIVEDEGELVGFLVGYLSQRVSDAGYVHYAGVRPDRRGRGIGREMYGRFVDLICECGRTRVVAETGAWNRASIAFHERVGFVLEPADEMVDGLPVQRDTTGMGFDFVRLTLRLGGAAG